jgi:hypothetical protein
MSNLTESESNRQKIKAKNVFILGAGFSADAGLPLSSNFVSEMEKVSEQYYYLGKSPPSLNVPMRDLFEYIEKHRHYFEPNSVNNIELWLSLVSARNIGNNNGRNFIKLQMQIMISQTIEYFVSLNNNTSYIDKFIRCAFVHEKDSCVITLNYDDLIERSCEKLKKPFRYGFKNFGFDNRFINYESSYTGKMLDINDHKSSLPILKLHGSYNWIAERNKLSQIDSVRIICDMRNAFNNKKFWFSDEWTKYRFVIEPPTIDKAYSGQALIEIWRRAYDALVMATHLYVVGYSFPENDGYIKYFLMASLADNRTLREVAIIDPGCDSYYKNRIKWLLNLLDRKGVKIRYFQQTAEDWIQNNMPASSA